MYRLLPGLCGLFMVLGLCAGQWPQGSRYSNLVCILDRNGYETIPSGSLYAVMGEFEACMLSFAVALHDRQPVLISDHIVKNVYDMLKFRGRADRACSLRKLVTSISDSAKNRYLNNNNLEIQKAQHWLQGNYAPSLERLLNFKKILKFKDVLSNKSTVFKTKTDSLHMMLILPGRGISNEDLRLQGFDPNEFELVSKNTLDAYFSCLYDSSQKVVSMSRPLDMNVFRTLFLTDHTLCRNIFLFGHGNIGVLAQLSYEQFKQFVDMLNAVGCTSLSIFSCHAGAQKNLEAYQMPSNFLKIIFSVGDIVARAWGYFDAAQKNFNFSLFFMKLQEFLRQKDILDPEALSFLCEAAAAIHVNDLHNYPWFCFPNSSALIHLSQLVERIKPLTKMVSEAEPSIESMSVVSSQSPGFAADRDMGIVTKEGYEAALVKGDDLIFENKRSLLLHVQCIALRMKFLNSVPVFLSMVDVPFYCIDTLDMNRLFFNTLLERIIPLRKVCAIKNLLCMNYSGSNIAQNRSGQLLCIKDCIIEPVPDTRFNRTGLLKALFRLSDGMYYTLEGFVENERLKKIVRRDGIQVDLEAEHARSIWQFFGLQKNSPFAQQILNSVERQRRQCAVAQIVPLTAAQVQSYIERIDEGESLAKRPRK